MKFYCYILRSTNPLYPNITYNGATVNLKRRLRQHNGEIVGGAKATRGKGPWVFYAVLTGFRSWNETLSCEWKIKHPFGRRLGKYSGIIGRIQSLNLILNLDTWTKNSTGINTKLSLNELSIDEQNIVEPDIVEHNTYYVYLSTDVIDIIDKNNIKQNVKILNLNLNINDLV